MNLWSPIFSKIVDSSLWREDDIVVKVFLTMLAKKDSDHVVRATAFMIGEWAKKTERQALDALKVLSEPDTKRLEPQPYDGRRVEKNEEGWLVLNGQYYEDLMRKTNIRAYKTGWQRNKRAEQKQVVLTGREADAYEKSSEKSHQARRGAVHMAGKRNGAQQAIREGFEEAAQ
jgi:hypothetical protein